MNVFTSGYIFSLDSKVSSPGVMLNTDTFWPDLLFFLSALDFLSFVPDWSFLVISEFFNVEYGLDKAGFILL